MILCRCVYVCMCFVILRARINCLYNIIFCTCNSDDCEEKALVKNVHFDNNYIIIKIVIICLNDLNNNIL